MSPTLDYSAAGINPLACDSDWLADAPITLPESSCGLAGTSGDFSWMDAQPCDSPLSPSTVASEVSSLDSALLVQQLLAASSSADMAAAHNGQVEDTTIEASQTDGISDDLAYSLPALLELIRTQSPSDLGFDVSPLSAEYQDVQTPSTDRRAFPTHTLADGGRVAYVPVYIPPTPSPVAGDNQLDSPVLTPTMARYDHHQQQPRVARKQSSRSSNGSEADAKCRGSQNKAATGSNRVPSLKDVVAEVYNEQPGCVITLRKIQKLGYKASHIIKQHFAKKYGVRVIRLRLVHSRSKGCVERPGQSGPLRPANMGFLVLGKPASVEKVLAGVSESGIEVINGVAISVLRFIRNPSHRDAPEVASARPSMVFDKQTNYAVPSSMMDQYSQSCSLWEPSLPESHMDPWAVPQSLVM
ncbi:hypothetical protein FOZ62_002207 [Perkinsus olseni]|uniref:Uncharacterized protein n=1 Tax=Perkinsus olseni TaxID=32597 RepID=A0A7J6R041_PEROL|nr:hypothetical protein FOZ62_002207 [Perkinsus olseni]